MFVDRDLLLRRSPDVVVRSSGPGPCIKLTFPSLRESVVVICLRALGLRPCLSSANHQSRPSGYSGDKKVSQATVKVWIPFSGDASAAAPVRPLEVLIMHLKKPRLLPLSAPPVYSLLLLPLVGTWSIVCTLCLSLMRLSFLLDFTAINSSLNMTPNRSIYSKYCIRNSSFCQVGVHLQGLLFLYSVRHEGKQKQKQKMHECTWRLNIVLLK